MSKTNKNFIDDMVNMFGYDYVIGYCICSEYDIKKRADAEEDAGKKKNLYKVARKYSIKKEQLIKERMENGL